MHKTPHSFVLILVLTYFSTAECGIFDWFRSRPKWWGKLEKIPLIETFYPKGLRISIGDFDGLQVFDFHYKINDNFRDKSDNGTFQFTLWEPTNGRFTYVDQDKELKEGDILYYWYYIKVNGQEHWSPRTLKLIQNIAPYPGEDLRFPRLQGPLCPCEMINSAVDRFSSNYIQCDRKEYQDMKKELENAKVQVNVLLESLLLLQKSDRNVPTLILTGKSSIETNPTEDVKRFLRNSLEITDLDDQIKQAHYTDCGILFELSTLIDKERVLIAAERELSTDSKRKIYEPEQAHCTVGNSDKIIDFEMFELQDRIGQVELEQR